MTDISPGNGSSTCYTPGDICNVFFTVLDMFISKQAIMYLVVPGMYFYTQFVLPFINLFFDLDLYNVLTLTYR